MLASKVLSTLVGSVFLFLAWTLPLQEVVQSGHLTESSWPLGGVGSFSSSADEREGVDAPSTVTFQQGVGGYTGTVDTFIASASPSADNSAATILTVDGSPLQHVLIRFDGPHGERDGQYVMHCHQLEHEGMGMMCNFVVV